MGPIRVGMIGWGGVQEGIAVDEAGGKDEPFAWVTLAWCSGSPSNASSLLESTTDGDNNTVPLWGVPL
jgi:hypothetical protein